MTANGARPEDGYNHPQPYPPPYPNEAGPGRGEWSKPWASNSGPASEHLPSIRDLPPPHDVPRRDPPSYESMPSRDYRRQSRSSMSIASNSMNGPGHIDGGSGAPSAQSAQVAARMALEHGRIMATGEDTERERMIAGKPFSPSDPLLTDERERCKLALYRFNSSINPAVWANPGPRGREQPLRDIFQPSGQSPMPGNSTSDNLGTGVIVDSPFNCLYGYNIKIGEDVQISENCNFVDSCKITIGARTWFGPNVTILTSMAMPQAQERKGVHARHQGRPVTIDVDCWIGAGAVIWPGSKIGRGAYVGPGEVVDGTIEPFQGRGQAPPSYMNMP